MQNIEDLSKGELLSLIYHNLPETLFRKHPCFCGSCCKAKSAKVTVKYPDKDRTVEAYGYICDQCNERFERIEAEGKERPR